MALHEVQLKGYSVRPGNLSLGTFDSYGIEQLHVTLDDTWSGLAVTATFNPPKGEPVEIRLPENGLIDVPAEATANEGTGAIVYCGVANGVQLITKTQGYNVITHGNVGGTEPFNPSESLATQVLQAALNAEKNSAEAKDVADGLRNDAASGKFDGKDGAKGDKGETGTTPQLKIGEDNLWQVSYDNGATWVSLGVKATGAAGKDGADGLTPHIGENGNWWVGDTDTGVSAKGPKGDPGPQGPPGEIPEDYPQIREDVSQLKEDTTALQKRQNVLVGSETGNPIAVDDAFAAPLCGLNVYGKSTQDGTPTPDAPVPIVSAGDGGSVTVKATGKNRMPPNLRKGGFVECSVKKNTQVTVVFKGDIVSQGGNLLFIGENNEQMWVGVDKGSAEKSVTLKTNATRFQYLLENIASENVCLTWNASSPNYEPYREQLLTLPTTNGLPGIPVASGGNYTDQNGQQWVCDEVDLERGVKVKRVNAVDLSTCVITGTTNLAATKRLAIRLPLKGKDYTVKALCNRLPYLVSFTSDTIHFYVDTNNVQVFIPIDAKNLEEGEYILFYVLATPHRNPAYSCWNCCLQSPHRLRTRHCGAGERRRRCKAGISARCKHCNQKV